MILNKEKQIKKNMQKTCKYNKAAKFFIIGIFLSLGCVFLANNAKAQCASCTGEAGLESDEQWGIDDEHRETRPENTTKHVIGEFTAHRSWIISILWEDNILPSMMLMADQLTAVAMQQVQIFGTMLDAKHQLESQRLIQSIQADAHKDYYPSEGLCEFGSSIKSLAASERKSEYTQFLLAQRSMDRQLGHANTSATYGGVLDKSNRLNQFKTTYCDPADNNNGLWQLCRDQAQPDTAANVSDEKRERYNKDIDYVRTVDFPWTIDADFTDTSLKNSEEDVMALASNLYTHHIFNRISDMENVEGLDIKTIQKRYMDMRALTAKRSVAENSFSAIASMKSQGTSGSKAFLDALLKELGLQGEELQTLMGDKPSYYAQMEVLTKKIYQNPDFYTNLYDKPANVLRKEVALQAVALMQKFDLFKSYLRSESSLSVLLELAVVDLQEELENEIAETPIDPEAESE